MRKAGSWVKAVGRDLKIRQAFERGRWPNMVFLTKARILTRSTIIWA